MDNSSFRGYPQSNSGQNPSNPISYLFILMVFGRFSLSLKGGTRDRKRLFLPRFLDFVSIKTVNHGAPLKTGPGVVFKDTKPAFYYIEWIVFACHPERFEYGISLAVAISDFFFNLITLLIGLEVLANNAL